MGCDENFSKTKTNRSQKYCINDPIDLRSTSIYEVAFNLNTEHFFVIKSKF